MASIKLTVNTNFADASKDIKSLGALTEAETKRMDKGLKNLSTESLDKFERNLKRTTAAIKATKGPTEAMRAQQRILSAQIQRSIKAGIDPLDSSLVKLQKEYADTTDKIEQTTKAQKKAEAQAKRNEQAMVALKVAVVAFGIKSLKAFIDFSNEAAKAASDAEEIESKYKTVFRDISLEAETAAATIADKFDLASSTINRLLGDAGDILTGLGFDQETALELSQSVATLGLDLASFTNFAGGAEGATQALVKAMLGEAESAKALGIVIRQDTAEYKDLIENIMKTEKVGLTQAKALAAIQIATEQSKNAVGDYERTMESAANVSKRLTEAQKSLKEEFGKVVLEGMTPFKSVLTDLTNEMATFLSQQNDANALLKDLKDGTVDSEMSLSDLESALAGLQERRNQYGGYSKEVQKEIDTVKVLIDTYGMQDTFLVKAKEAQLALARAAADAAKAEKAKLDIQAAAAGKLEEMQEANLTTSEKQIKALQDQINYWVQFRDITGVQALINELVGDRNALMEEGVEKSSELLEIEKEMMNTELEAQKQHNQNIIDLYEWRTNKAREEAAARIEIRNMELTQASGFFGAMSELVSSFGSKSREALIANKIFSSIQAGINSYLAFTQVLADPSLIGRPFTRAIAAGTVLASGLAQQIKINSVSVPSAETGGRFTVPEASGASRSDSVGMNVNPGETVQVFPRGEESSRGITVNNYLDRELLYSVMQEGFDAGEINITTDNIQEAV